EQAEVAERLQADVVEWRADSYGELNAGSLVEAAHALRRVLQRQPILFTLRIASEGGATEMPQDLRIECIDAVLRSAAIDIIDIELCNGPAIVQSVIETAHGQARHVIMSFHDFQGTPEHEILFRRISEMIGHGADIAKIACMPR